MTSWLVLWAFGLPVAAESGPALMVAYPAPSQSERDLREALKQARARASLDVDTAPIMPLYWSDQTHRQFLEGLGLQADQLPMVGLVSRSTSGWPAAIDERLAVSLSADQILKRYKQRYLADQGKSQVGILTVIDSRRQAKDVTTPMLRELGLLLSQTYGTLKPPFPLGAYDVAKPSEYAYVTKTLGIGSEELPTAVAASFRSGVPTRVVRRITSLDQPALAARELMAAVRGPAPASLAVPEAAPSPSPIVYTHEGLVVSVVRAHQLAEQLWNRVRNLPLAGDDAARRNLLGLVETSGRLRSLYEAGQEPGQEDFRLALTTIRDFRKTHQQLHLDTEYQAVEKSLMEVLDQVLVAHQQLH
ncbi:MAG: hypothetical protein KC910_17910 [Candidatus Eremiobacteraeota bacterium]|nr:hypothetical protein [Candidatus Eremiobacteraeota bacterium]